MILLGVYGRITPPHRDSCSTFKESRSWREEREEGERWGRGEIGGEGSEKEEGKEEIKREGGERGR